MLESRGSLAVLLGALVVASLGCPPAKSAAPDAGPGTQNETDAGNGDPGHPDAGGMPETITVDLRADTNRDGVVSFDDDSDDLAEDTWDQTHGAIFLANLDDDQQVCKYTSNATNKDLAACHDAADSVINGDDDLLDLAPLKTKAWAEAPEGTVGRLQISSPGSSHVRLFISSGGAWTEYLPGSEILTPDLREGVSFALEGTDIVRDRAAWDGFVDLSFEVTIPDHTQPVKDSVRMRLSPVMTFHHLLPAETVYVTRIAGDSDSSAFQTALNDAVTTANVTNPLYKVTVSAGSYADQWTQDFFETAWESMPAPNGEQHVIRINYRSANIYEELNNDPLRPYGRIVYLLRGKDVGAVEQYDLESDPYMDSLNSFGNTETIPPYSLNGVDYPLGRLFRGSVPSFHPDRSFSKMLESQGQQPPVYVDTSWLLVGHVDETVSFLKVNSPRGWIVLVNDPRLARQMLEDEVAKGNGNAKMFVGQSWWDDNYNPVPAEVTISQVLADTDVMDESATSAAEVDAQLEILEQETGLSEDEIIRVPYLHQPVDGYSVAYQPGTVNLISITPTHVGVPDPHGPVIDGVDIFKKQLEDALTPHGISISWIDDWALYHALDGEVHCGTNAARSIPSVKWWETGR